MAKHKCNECSKSFPKLHGLNIHKMRMHSGKTWSTTKKVSTMATASKKRRTVKSGSVRDKLRRVLADNPDGLQVKHIATAMRKLGHRPKGDAGAYISQSATNDPNIVKVERGIYRLSDKFLAEMRSPQPEAAPVAPVAVAEPEVELPREALLLRIEQLTKTNHALSNLINASSSASNVFVRELAHD